MPTRPIAELEAQVGTTVETVRNLRIESGKVSEFTRALRGEVAAMGQTDDDIQVPLTFTRTAYFPRYRPSGIDTNLGFDLGLRSEHVLHGEQDYRYHRPLKVGDVLSGRTTLEDVHQREGRRGGTLTFAIYVTEFRDETDALVCTARLTRIETDGPVDTEQDPATGPTDHNRETTDEVRSVGGISNVDLPVAELTVGDSGPTLVVDDVNREDFVRYAGASGDFDPIHYDGPYAKEAGNPSVFGQGMLTAGYTSRLVAEWLGVETVSTFGVRFLSRLWPGDTVTVTSTVSEMREAGDSTTVDLKLVARNGRDDRLLNGSATATIPRR